MYCILVSGIPAAGKSTIAALLSKRLNLPLLSKDSIKEILFDQIGFQSREEKVRLGTASMEIMYYAAAQLMNQIFLSSSKTTSKIPPRKGLTAFSAPMTARQ